MYELQKFTDKWIKSVGVRYFNELTNMVLLTEELGELARTIASVYGEQSFKDNEDKKSIEEEMADILWILICLANQIGVDLTKAFINKYQKKHCKTIIETKTIIN